jgi:hypothetical protein
MTHDDSCEAALEQSLRDYFRDELGTVATPEMVWQRVSRRLDLDKGQSPLEHVASACATNKGVQIASVKDNVVPMPGQPKRQQGNRWPGFAAVAAALLVIALGATIFGVLGGGRSLRTHIGANPTSTPQRTTQTPLPPGIKQFTGVSMVSASHGWAIGNVEATNGEHTGFIEQYGDGQWSLTDARFPGAQLLSITMQASGTGWIVGQSEKLADEPPQPAQPPKLIITSTFLLRFAQGNWIRESVPADVETSSVHMISADFGWAIAWSTDVAVSSPAFGAQKTNHQILERYVGGTWQSSATPAMLTALWLSSPNEGWASDGVRFWRYQAGQWSAGPETGGIVSDLAMTSKTDGWATGYIPQGEMSPTTKEVPARPLLVHFDGMTWVPSPLAADALPHDSWTQRVFLASTIEGWATGGANGAAPSVALHYLDGAWSQVPVPAGVSLLTVSSGATDDAWATGVDYQADGVADQAVLLHYAHGVWTGAQG